MYQSYIKTYLEETAKIAQQLAEENVEDIENIIEIVKQVKENKGNIFFIGVGGGSGTGSHAKNDFNKIGGVSSYNLTDNASLVTALANDEGWDSIFVRQMQMHNFDGDDALFIFSVGGGSETTSPNIVKAIDHAKECNAKILGVVGKDNGHAAKHGDGVAIIPTMHVDRITAHTENWQLVLNHLIVNAIANVK